MDEPIPQVDGLRLLERADAGEWVGRGEVWRARITGGLAGDEGSRLPADLPGVGECRIRLLRMPVDEALRGRALTVAEDLIALDDPGLVPIRSVRRGYDGIALVYGHLPAPSTGLHRLARRRLLSAGEVVTLGVALCWALAHAHAAGITHGRICDADVLIGPDGRPVLTGVGVSGVLGAPGDPEGDVRALERMLASLLDHASAAAGRVSEALSAGSPTAAGLAALLAGSAPAEPLQLDDAGPASEEVPPRRRYLGPRLPGLGRVRPRMLAAGTGVVLLGALAGLGQRSGPALERRRRAQPRPARAARCRRRWTGGRSWRSWIWRARRCSSGPVSWISAASMSRGVRRTGYDTAAVAALRAHGVHAVGLRLVLESVRVESATARRVTLRVTDRRLAYELREGSGKLVSRTPARGAAAHVIELEASSAGAWRFVKLSDPAVSS